MTDVRGRMRALALASLLATGAAAAQPAPGCADALVRAQAQYQDGAFEAVAGLLAPCLDRPDRSEEQALEAYRLLALASLRQDRLEEARLAGLNLFHLDPRYAPDPVRDPPAYVALIETLRRQLALALPEPDTLLAPPDTLEAPAPVPYTPPDRDRLSRFTVAFWGGVGSYGGERGRAGATRFREFTDNAGLALGAGVGYALGAGVSAFAEGGLGLYPTKNGAPGDTYASTWLADVTVSLLAVVRPSWPTSPYARAGAALTLAAVDGVGRLGGGPVGALGAEVDLGQRYRLYVEGGGTLILPGGATDGVSTSGGGDFFTHVRAGFRYRLLRP